MKYSIEKIKDDISIIHVDNEVSLKADLVTFGAGVYKLTFDDTPIILTLTDVEDYLYSPQYFGKTLGPVAGRLKKKGLIDGNEYVLNCQESKRFSLHGGELKGVSFKNFDYKIKESNKKLDVVFSYTTRLNEAGFPGKLRIYVTYSFIKGKNEFKILYKATTPSEATFCNLSSHMYFNLGDKNISNHYLKMNVYNVAKCEDDLLIVDKEPVKSELDFKKSAKLNPRIDYIEKHDFKKTIDDTFIFDENPGKVSLWNDKFRLDLTTDCSAMNIYVDNSGTDVHFINENDSEKRRGIALEPQRFILNNKEITLKKGEVYKNFIDYKFKKR